MVCQRGGREGALGVFRGFGQKCRNKTVWSNRIIHTFYCHLQAFVRSDGRRFIFYYFIRPANGNVVAFDKGHRVWAFHGNRLCRYMHHTGIRLKDFRHKLFSRVMSHNVWRSDIYIYPTHSESAPKRIGGNGKKPSGCLIPCCLIYHM